MQLKEAIEYAMEEGGLTVSDLAILLNRQRITVRTWRLGTKPKPHAARDIWRKLNTVTAHVKQNGPLIPPDTNERHRRGIVEGIRNELFGVPAEDTA
jgi:hypothetical protein